MDPNDKFKNIGNFNLNPFDINGCFYYQPPYFNLPPYNLINNDYLWNIPNSFEINQNYSQILINQPHNLINNIDPKYIKKNEKIDIKEIEKINKNEKINVKQNDKIDIKQNEIKSIFKQNNSQRKSNYKVSQKLKDKDNYFDVLGSSKLLDKKYTILSRPSNKNESLSEICENVSKILVNEKDFPPISANNIQNKETKVTNSKLDFKLALQKPKKIDIIKVEEKVEESDIIKKKRKRKRRKKIQSDEIKPFEYIDGEFPNLGSVKSEVQITTETVHKQNKDNIASTADSDKKKSRRRQLLLILPKDMEGQVRIVDATSAKKSKIKRKVYQDRMKKSIGLLNPLNLSGPIVKRGKERLIPKVKKPSKLKKTILLCRSQKKELRDNVKKASFLLDSGDIVHEECEKVIEISHEKNDHSINKMHSKNFREYCNHMVDNNINSIISTLLKTLMNFQDKLYNRDPIKARMKRRLCFGLREVTKFVNMKKLRLIIIAPDLEKIDVQGGLDDIVGNVIKIARETSIPCVFGLNRSSLAYLCFKKFRVGAIGIFNYDGAESHVKELLKAVDAAREQYNQLRQIMQSMTQDVAVLPEAVNDTFHSCIQNHDDINHQNYCAYVGHSRTPSNALSEPISEIIENNRSTFNSIFEDQNHTNTASDLPNDKLSEDAEDSLIELFVDDILNSISKLNIKQ